MRVLLLLLAASGCTSMTARSGIVVIGGRPAFQASIEIGPSAFGKRHGVTAAGDLGVEADADGARMVTGYSVDLFQNDEEVGPVARIGARFRGALTDDRRHQNAAVLVRSAGFVGFARDPARNTAGLGVEIAGGATLSPTTQPIFEANLVIGGKFTRASE